MALSEQEKTRPSETDHLNSTDNVKIGLDPLLAKPNDSERHSSLNVIWTVGFYICVSIIAILTNKAVLNRIGLPIIFLWGQMVVAVLVLRIVGRLGAGQIPSLSLQAVRTLYPLIAINVLGLVLNTLCLHKVDAIIYQVTRSLVIPMTATLSSILEQNRISKSIRMSCAVICAGFLVGILGERHGNVSVEGLVFGVLSSLTTTIHSFVIKRYFANNYGAFELLYYNNLMSAIPLLLLVPLELNSLSTMYRLEGLEGLKLFFWATLVAGLTGLLINLAGFLQIKVTSPLTHMVSSASRGVLQTLAANLFLGEMISSARLVGIALTLSGSLLYSYLKSK